MKKTVVKAALIVCAAVTCLARLISFKYESSLSPRAVGALWIASAAGAALCALFAALWIIFEKKEEKGA